MTATTHKLRLGVLGLGEGRSILSAAINSDLWTLTQMCDLNESLCRERAAEFRFENYTTSFEQMLANPDVDVVAIYTPDPLHGKHIRQALQAGKHVICTKPLLDDLAEAKELLQVQKQSGKLVFVGQSSRFFESMIRQRADFEDGQHGDLFSVEAHYHADNRWFSKKTWASSGGCKWLYNGLSHPVDLVRWYLPDIEEVFGYGLLTANGKQVGLTHPDSMHFVFKTRGGKIARVSGCYSSTPVNHQRDSHMTCILRGEKGASQADYSDLRYSTHFSGQGCVQYDIEHRAPYYFRFGGRGHHAGEYQNYIEYFARCVSAGRTPNPDITEGIVTVAIMKAMELSMATGQPVKVRSILEQYQMPELSG
jgi:predicted dehydrogenase